MNTEPAWFKSSYSNTEGGECLEVAYAWRKSSHRDDQGSACVEVAACPRAIHVRDSKLGARSPQFAVPAGVWSTFVTYARGV